VYKSQALQPIVNVRTGVIEKHEALLRLLDADGKPIMPSGFVPSAERFGLILDIDCWVVEHAIDLLRRRNSPGEQLSINLSAKSIGDPNLLIHTTRVLEESCIDPTRLTFELTETVAIADLSAAIDLLHQLRDLGCRTALDDFGAGYSSFAYLKDLPVDYVKIDGTFVRNIHDDPVHLAMVKSMNEIAHAMGKKTVAEFVINARILAMLAEIGVDYAQGFHVGAPALAGYPDLVALPETLMARV
jgi:EAL domain-containing protein (putative c-di-GMP-specific phosphodiesterase class I)